MLKTNISPQRLSLIIKIMHGINHARSASATEPSGCAMFLTYLFKVHNSLSIGYIHPEKEKTKIKKKKTKTEKEKKK